MRLNLQNEKEKFEQDVNRQLQDQAVKHEAEITKQQLQFVRDNEQVAQVRAEFDQNLTSEKLFHQSEMTRLSDQKDIQIDELKKELKLMGNDHNKEIKMKDRELKRLDRDM